MLMEIGKDALILDTIRVKLKSYSISPCNSLKRRRMLTMQEDCECMLIIFSSTELLVQGRLFVMSKQNYLDKPNYKRTMSEFSKFVKLSNMDPRYSKTLGDLSRLRDEARYQKRPFSLEESEPQEYIMTVEELAEDVRRSIL